MTVWVTCLDQFMQRLEAKNDKEEYLSDFMCVSAALHLFSKLMK